MILFGRNQGLKDPEFFGEDEFQDFDEFVREIQQDRTLEYKRSCGNKLWRFYTEYLEVQPQIAAEIEGILKHMVETILDPTPRKEDKNEIDGDGTRFCRQSALQADG